MYVYRAKVLKVVDGDTLDLEVDLGFSIKHEIRVRLARIDTPEIHGVKKESDEYKKGLLASYFTKDFVDSSNNNVLIITYKDMAGKYGRYIVELMALEGPNKDKNLNEELLNSGNAVLYE